MSDIKIIREQFKKYLYEQVANNKLSKIDASTRYSDADYPRKHANELGINYWQSFKSKDNLEKLISILKAQFEKEGKNPTTIQAYRRALDSFMNFIEKQYGGVNKILNVLSKHYYWVNQGKEYPDNKNYIQAPNDNIEGHKLVQDIKIGDKILSYVREKGGIFRELTAISAPEKFDNQFDKQEWYRVKVTEEFFHKPISLYDLQNLNIDISKINDKNIPWNKDYKKVKQKRYLVKIHENIYNLIKNEKLDEEKILMNEVNSKKFSNQILYGPPGTGKTYNTVLKAMEIINPSCIRRDENGDVKNYSEVKKEFDNAKFNHQIEFVTFHQSYSYEEFVEGIKPELQNEDNLKYILENGIFKEICKNATKKITDNFEDVYNNFINEVSKVDEDDFYKLYTLKNHKIFGLQVNGNNNLNIYMTDNFNKQGVITKENLKKHFENMRVARDWINYYDAIIEHLKNNYNLVSENTALKPHVLIIDEINRGNISKIFGELITLIEDDKRENLSVKLPYSQESFTVPKNLYIIGTMNTSDRSIASIDIALRRRFKFVEMMPQPDLVADFGCNFRKCFEILNKRISILLDRDHQIGHSYFVETKHKNDGIDELKEIWFSEILPLLNEYFYSDWEKLQAILGQAKKDGTSFIKKIDKISFANNYSCDDDNENYDFTSETECKFEFAMKTAFSDDFEA